MAVVSDLDGGLRALRHQPTLLQVRAPGNGAAAVLAIARQLTAAATIPVLLSSRVDVALAAGAAGVNLPEKDIAAADARSLLGDSALIGRSVHSRDAALAAEREGADYVLFGPVFATATHLDVKPAGLQALRDVVEGVQIPVLAIGGMTRARAEECLATGAAGYAAIRMFG